MLKTFGVALLGLSFLTLAAVDFRVDIAGLAASGKVKLTAVGGDKLMKLAPMAWHKEETRPYTLFGQLPLKEGEWTVCSFSFKAEEAGVISLSFCGNWTKEAADRPWILVSTLKQNDNLMTNGDFAVTVKRNDKEIPEGFGLTGKAVLGEGPEGAKAALVNHDNRLGRNISVKAGEVCTITVLAKPAAPPEN